MIILNVEFSWLLFYIHAVCINFDWTGHLAFVRKHTEIKDIDEGYEVEISPESQEVKQNYFFLNLMNYLRRTAVLIF